MSNNSEVKEAMDAAKDYMKQEILYVADPINPDGPKVPFLVRQPSQSVESLKNVIEGFRPLPERHKGTSSHKTAQSFIEHVNRFKDKDASVIFASPGSPGSNPQIRCVYNYQTKDKTNWRDYAATFSCDLSDEWKAWQKHNGSAMSQIDFALLVENRIDDIMPDQDLAAPDNATIAQLSTLLGYSIAWKTRMLELSRGIAINESSKARQIVNLASGEGQIEYVNDHNDSTGQRLKVPGLFMICIPVFRDGPLWRIPVRLRYRLSEGKIAWIYEIYRGDKVFDSAFDEVCQDIVSHTELPMFVGSPE